MRISTETTIVFEMPQDKELHENFMESTDLSEWDCDNIDNEIIYTQIRESGSRKA